ncbi:MAG: heme-binding protein [Verrucomicrobiota bacterium]
MKVALISILSLSLLVVGGVAAEKSAGAPASYVNEAQLPQGWPAPGPYGQVVAKEYPVYRAAFTDGRMSGPTFMRLFRHISSKNIPMTAPVEMEMEEDGEAMDMVSMAFLYQNAEVGELGMDGKKVEVKDVAAMKVLSYAWQGSRGDEKVAEARAALEDVLKEKGLEAESFRLLGYNGPGTPRKERTHELQAVLK